MFFKESLRCKKLQNTYIEIKKATVTKNRRGLHSRRRLFKIITINYP